MKAIYKKRPCFNSYKHPSHVYIRIKSNGSKTFICPGKGGGAH